MTGNNTNSEFSDVENNVKEHGRESDSIPGSPVLDNNNEKEAPVAQNEADVPAAEKMTKAQTAIIMFALCMAVFLAALDVTIVTTALPTISQDFHSSSVFTWVGSAYLLGAASATTVWAKFSDIFGRKPIIIIANVTFFVGTLVSALAKTNGAIIVGRSIQGIGGGGLITLVNVAIGDLFSMRTRGMYYGIVGFVWALASAIGPLVGGAFTEKVTWRWCFYINIPFQVITVLIIIFLFHIYKPKTPVKQGLIAIDWIGCLLIVGGIVMFLLGLQFGGESHPWKSATVICLLVFGVFVIVFFGIWEAFLAKYPLVPLHIFEHRSNIAVFAVCFCHGFVFIGGSFYLPLYFQGVLGHSPILSGVLLLAYVISLSLLSVASGVFIRKTGLYLPPIWFGLTFLVLGFGLFLNWGATPSIGKIIGFQIVAGIGTGPLFQAPLIALQSLIPPRDIASAVATFQLVRNIATSMSVVIGSVVFQNAMTKRLPTLVAALGQPLASQLSGFQAAASVTLVQSLPPAQRTIARGVVADSLHDMWIMYVAFAALGLFCSFFITKQTLQKKHEETKTGLEAEESKRVDREARKQSKKDHRRESKALASPLSPTKEEV
jgi:EmrB/QacA subfamily drug resistance transporter